MFNYYNRIARYAADLENNGKQERAEEVREILKTENRCIICGSLKVMNSGTWECILCNRGNKLLKNNTRNNESNYRKK